MSAGGPEERWIQPDWYGPADDWIGGVLPFNVIVARGEHGVILARDLAVFPTGITFTFHALARPSRGASLPDPEGTGIRFGFEFADGRRAELDAPVGGPGGFTLRGHEEGDARSPDPSRNIVLNVWGGGSSPDWIRWRCFLWPLPPAGDLRLFGAWEEAEVDLQEALIEAADLADARSHARRLPRFFLGG